MRPLAQERVAMGLFWFVLIGCAVLVLAAGSYLGVLLYQAVTR